MSKPDYVFKQAPADGDVAVAAPGIYWVQQRLPFALDHVNCWLLGEPGEQVLIDTGINSDATRAIWTAIHTEHVLAAAPKALLVTHFHPDHMGLAGWFHESGTDLYGSRIEVDVSSRIWAVNDVDYANYYAHWYASNGLPDEVVAQVSKRGNSYRKIVHEPPAASSWQWLEDGSDIELAGQHFRVMHGRGHAPSMIMLYSESSQILIAADQVLPAISPNVSIMPLQNDPNPLASFLQTLDKLAELPADTLVLPSHGLPFRGLHARLDVLRQHHQARLHDVLEHCTQARCAHDFFSVLFRRELDAQQMSFALGESLAHLEYLRFDGQLVCDDSGTVRRYSRS